MKSVFTLIVISVAAMLAMLAMGAQTSPDEPFYESAGEGGLAEVAAGRLAEDKASTPALRNFAGMMVKDYSMADQKLWAAAAASAIKMPTTPGLEQVAARDHLKLLSGGSFDRAYIKGQIDAHRETLLLLKKEIASGHDEGARQFATATLPAVQAHLDEILELASEAGVSTH